MSQAEDAFAENIASPDPGTEPEEFAQAVDDAFASEVPPSEAPSEAPAEEEVEPEPAAETPPPPPPEEIDLGGVRIPAAQAEAVANFYQWSQLPEEDYTDPELKKLSDTLTLTRSELEDLRGRMQAQSLSTAQAMINRAATEFSSEHHLSTEETRTLLDHVEKTASLAGYAADPATGQMRDGLATLTAAMEAAYWAKPEFRQKELDRLQTEHKSQQKKDRKLAAVGGTSGSVPQRPEPQSPAEAEEWAVAQISDAMGFTK